MRDTPRIARSGNSERGIAPIVALAVVALLALSGAFYVATRESPSADEDADTRPNILATSESTSTHQPAWASKSLGAEQNPSSAGDAAAKLEAELTIALKAGGISPSRFASLQKEIDALMQSGLDVSELRALLAGLSVGGSKTAKPPAAPPAPPKSMEERIETRPFWEHDPSKPEKGWYWARDGEPPVCDDPVVIESPVDPSLVQAILYPGQVRGDGPKDFKPHGGFILKAGNKSVELRAPMDGYLTAAMKVTDAHGLNIGLTFTTPCGLVFGGGHYGVVPPDLQKVLEVVPLRVFPESQTTQIIPPYPVHKGQVIVTALQTGAPEDRPGFDWGVADYRQRNAASKDPRFQSLYGYAPWNTYYGICWLDWLPSDQQSILKALPGGDGKEGKNSEYCH